MDYAIETFNAFKLHVANMKLRESVKQGANQMDWRVRKIHVPLTGRQIAYKN